MSALLSLIHQSDQSNRPVELSMGSQRLLTSLLILDFVSIDDATQTLLPAVCWQ